MGRCDGTNSVKWGCPWGLFWGVISAENIRITDFEETPPAMFVTWLEDSAAGVSYHVYVDGKFYAKTSATEILAQLQSFGRHFVQVFIVPPGAQFTNIDCELETIPGGRVRLTWTASVSPDLDHYEIFWDEGIGTSPLVLLGKTKEFETEFITGELADATYNFRVDPVDRAGNRLQSGFTCVAIIAKFPIAPTALQLDSYSEATDDADFSFIESVDPGVTEYRTYLNGGGGGYIDYSTVVATVLAGNNTFTLNLPLPGKYSVGIRAFNGTLEENNVDVFVNFELGDVPVDVLDPQPNKPDSLVALPSLGGSFSLVCQYDAFEEAGKATQINFYTNDGLGGAIDFNSIIVSSPVPDHALGEIAIFEISATSLALIDGNTYIWAVKSATITGRESEASEAASGVSDATNPLDIADLVCEVVNFEE